MTTRAKSTKFLKLQRGDGATPEVFTTIAEITNITIPGEEAPDIDVTSFDSEGKEYIGGLQDGGELTIEMNFIGPDAQQQGLRTDQRAQTLRNFKFISNDHTVSPTTMSFSALVKKGPGLTAGVNAAQKSGATLKISGLPTWTFPPG